MTRQEALQVLAVLKAAYPNSYKNLDADTAKATVNIWATQFVNIPSNVVMLAINKLISTNTFPPSINEVKEKIRGLYWEAWQMLENHKRATVGLRMTDDPNEEPIMWETGKLDDKTLKLVKDIIAVCDPMRTQSQLEPSLSDLLNGYGNYLGTGRADLKQIK